MFIGRIFDFWSWNSSTLAIWCKELTHLKRPWCWERLKAGGEGDDRGWDGWMASLTQWTWVWVDSGSWWWTGRPGVLQFMSSWVRHDWVTELNWTHNAGDTGWSLFWEDATCRRETARVCATTTELAHRAQKQQLLKPRDPNAHVPQPGKPHNEKAACRNQRKPAGSKEDPAQPKSNKQVNVKINGSPAWLHNYTTNASFDTGRGTTCSPTVSWHQPRSVALSPAQGPGLLARRGGGVREQNIFRD